MRQAYPITGILDFVNDPLNPSTAPPKELTRWYRHHVAALRRFMKSPAVEVLRRHKDKRLDPDDLVALQVELSHLLEGAISDDGISFNMLPLPTLLFGVRNVEGVVIRRVTGNPRDVLMYLVLHALTTEDMAGMLTRCQAPAPYDWKRKCDNWCLRTGRGFKRQCCSHKCRTRKYSKNEKKKRLSIADQLKGQR